MHRVPGAHSCLWPILLDPQSTFSLGVKLRFGVFTPKDIISHGGTLGNMGTERWAWNPFQLSPRSKDSSL